MTDLWCPFADFAPVHGHDHTGPMVGGAAKIVHHTTEGEKISGAETTYEQTGDLPHFTDTFERGYYEVHQHLPLDQYATALKHPAGLGETGRDHAVQIEHVGFTATSSGWSDGFLDGIAILCRWIEAQTGCMRVSIAPFVPGARRLSWPEWHGASGHCGHMHVPFNDHVDPGAMNIGRVLVAGIPNPEPVVEMEVDVQIAGTAKTAFLSVVETGTAGAPNAGYELHADGGIDAINGAPFYGGYFNKPPEVWKAPQPQRAFLALTPRSDGQPGYVIWAADGAFYAFGPDLWNPDTQVAA